MKTSIFSRLCAILSVVAALVSPAQTKAAVTLDTTFDAVVAPNIQFTSYVYVTAVQPDGKLLVGGAFTSILGVARNNIARLNANGTLDATFNPNADGEVNSIAVLPDGKILVAGLFNNIGGQARPLLARLNATTGAADTGFNANVVGTNVFSIAVQTDGNIVVGGVFTNMGGQARINLARLGTTGAADSFNPSPNSTVRALAIQRDGKILVGGLFTTIAGQTRNRIARFDSNGTLDSFDPNVSNSNVRTFAIQADGKILVGGGFSGTIGGQSRLRIARLDPTTGLADSFDPSASQTVYSIIVQADGRILLGGLFTTLTPNGGAVVTRNRIARVNSDGTLDAGFDPNADEQVYSIALLTDGRLMAGGTFLNIGGGARSFLARLTNDTAATQSLGATPSSVIWTRGGSSAQFNRVTFESSTDNVNFSALGAGTPSGSDWTLAGLSLPTGQTIYIRGRGYYRTGYQGGSEAGLELVQSFTLAPPVSSNADLSALSTTAGSITFAAVTTGYAVSVPNATTSATVTATRADANATLQVQVNGGGFSALTSGSASNALNLNVGANTIDVRVTAQDGTTIKTYTITVTRAAAPVVYNMRLSGAAESPPNNSLGIGTGTVTIDNTLKTMTINLSFSGLSGNTTNAHIHSATASPLTGTAGVATTTPSFVNFPTGVTAGTFTQTYDMTLAGSYNAAFITANGGTTATAFTALVSSFNAGTAYFNIHTSFAPGGEIRSFIGDFPEITVTESAADVADGGSLSFGSTPVGTSVTKTFTVNNIGTANLTLSNLTVPVGFSITQTFGSTTVAPGTSTTFLVTMSAAAAATPSGTLSFDTNDLNENPYNFTVSGTVNPSNNADLSALTLTTATINEAFAANTISYTSNVPNATSSVTVTPTVAQANATVQARVGANAFAPVTSGSPSASLPLAVGANTIEVKVTAQDGTTIKTYTITVTRAAPPGVTFSTGMAASMVVGQTDLISVNTTPSQSIARGPRCVAFSATGKMAVADEIANRVLLWNALPTSNGQPADVVIGQTDFSATTSGSGASGLNGPSYVTFSSDGTKLLIADAFNHRVLIFNSIPTANGASADVVVGQASFATTTSSGATQTGLNNPVALLVTLDGKLLVSDENNSRVLIYNSIPTANGAAADTVIGQTDFVTSAGGSTSAKFSFPFGLCRAADGRLLVADFFNNRVLIFNSIPTTNGASADVVIGQTATNLNTQPTLPAANNLDGPAGVAVSPSGQLAVSDLLDHRVLIFNSVPTTNNASADFVLGQPNTTSEGPYNPGSAPSATNMNQADFSAFSADGRLWVPGRNMRRVMVFGTASSGAPEIAVTESAANVADGGSLSFGTTTVGTPVTKTFTVTNSGSATLNLSALSVPTGFTITQNFASSAVAASGGSTTFQITMTAAAVATPSGSLTFINNDADEGNYDFTISGTVNPSNNADLSALTLTTATINEAFAANTISYTSNVPNATSSVTVTPTVAQANATVQARVGANPFAPVPSGSPSAALALAVGPNTIEVKVTAQDGTTIKTYTITVTRDAPPSPIVTGISPNNGPTAGGTAVTISGSNFTGAIAVTIGGAAAASFSVTNDTTISAVTPAGNAGAASVLVSTLSGTNAANTLYTYTAGPLVAGDIATVCYNSDGNDDFALMALRPIPGSSVFFVTDSGYSTLNSNLMPEGSPAQRQIQFTVAAGGIPFGTIIRINQPGGVATLANAALGTLSMVDRSAGGQTNTGLSFPTSGDQILVYTTAGNTPTGAATMISGFNASTTDGGLTLTISNGWQVGTLPVTGQTFALSDSNLPAGLTAYNGANASAATALGLASFPVGGLTNLNNYKYIGPINLANKTAFQTAINNPANWAANDGTPYDPLTVGPPPASPPTVALNSAGIFANSTTLTISGTNFDTNNFGNNVVTFTPAGTTGTVTSATPTSLTVTGLAGLVQGNLSAVVATTAGNSGAPVQVATIRPFVTATTTALLTTDTTVTISGFGFSTTPGSNTVVFSPAGTGTVTASTNTSLTVTGVSGLTAGTLNAVVTTPSGNSGAATQVAFVSTAGGPVAPTLAWSSVQSSGTPAFGRGRAVGALNSGEVISGTTISSSPTATSGKRIIRHAAATGLAVWSRDYKDAVSSEDINDMVVNPVTGDTYVCSRASRGTGAGELNWFVTKLNGSNGNTAWTYEYDGAGVGSDNDECFAIALTSDGNVVAVGQHNGGLDGRVAKINSGSGTEMWARSVSSGISNIFTDLRSVAADSLGNVYVMGTYDTGAISNPNVIVLKFGPSSGTPLWSVQLDGIFAGQTDSGANIAVGPDNQPVIASLCRQAAASSLNDICIYKLNAVDGGITWTRQLGGTALASDTVADIQVDGGNDVYIAGALRMNAATPDRVAYAAKLNGANGNVAWEFTKNGSAAAGANTVDRYFNVQLANSSVYLSGTIANASSDLLLTRLNAASGAEQWSVIYDHSSASVDSIANTRHSLAVDGADACAMSAETGSTLGLILQFGAPTVPPPAPEMNVKGNGNTIADGASTPSTTDHTDFGTANIGLTTVVRTFTIENLGTAALNLTGAPNKVVVGGTNAPDFSVTALPTSPVAAAGSTTFQVTFTPGGKGLRSATLSIDNNDTDENPYNFSIQGTGADVTPPVISGTPANITGQEATSPAGRVVFYASPTALDAVDGPRTVTCVPASGSTFGLGTTPVTCSASDLSGNPASSNFSVTVVDTTPPVITGTPANIVGVIATSPAGAVVTFASPTANDIVDGPRPVTCSPASGSTFAIGTTTVTCTSTDTRANSASTSFTVNVMNPAPAPVPTSTGGQLGSGEPAGNGSGAAGIGTWDTLRTGAVLAANGDIGFRANLLVGSGTPPVTSQDFQGIWKDNGVTTALKGRAGSIAPGANNGVWDQLPTNPWLASDGRTTFGGLLRSGTGSPAVTSNTDGGMWTELGNGTLKLLLREGDSIPGIATFVVDLLPQTVVASSTAGNAAFTIRMRNGAARTTALVRADVSGGGVVTLSAVATQNGAAPAIGGGNLGTFYVLNGNFTDPRMNDAGNIAFAATLNTGGGVTGVNDTQGVWFQASSASALAAVARAGSTAPGTSGAKFTAFERPTIADGGFVAFRGFIDATGDNTLNDKSQGIWASPNGTAASLVPVIRTGDTGISGMPEGATVASIWSPFSSKSGKIAFRASIIDGGIEKRAIFTNNSGTMKMLFMVGSAVPDIQGMTFDNFDHPVIGDSGHLAFTASTSGGVYGVWKEIVAGSNTMNLLMKVGDNVTTSQGVKSVASLSVPGTGTTDRIYEQEVIDAAGEMLIFVTYGDASQGILLSP